MPHTRRPRALTRFLLLAPPLAVAALAALWLLHSGIPGAFRQEHVLIEGAGLLVLVGLLSWLWASAGMRRDLAAEELRRSRETARAILDAPQDAAYLLLSRDGLILACNPAAARRFHLETPAELEGQNLFDLGTPELAAARRAQFRTVLETGTPLRFTDERAGLHLDNSLYPAPPGEDGAPRLVLLSRDVTAERRNREQLLLLSRAVEQSPAMVLITDPSGRIEYVNPKFTQVYGYTRAEIVGQNPRLLKSDCQSPEFYAEMWRTILDGRDWNGEMCNRTKDGRVIWERVAISPVNDDSGRLIHFVAVKEDITERREYELRLRELATTDGLTGLSNRRHFMELAGAEIERARRYDRPLSMIMFDVDHFKDVNDTWGHAAGDLVLRTLAATALGTLRGVDLLGRVGGEEFAALLLETGPDEAREAAERLRLTVAATSLMADGETLTATISVGLAHFQGGSESLEDLLKRADKALYAAKAAGRNRTAEA